MGVITYASILGRMNTHVAPILRFTRGLQGFDPQPPIFHHGLPMAADSILRLRGAGGSHVAGGHLRPGARSFELQASPPRWSPSFRSDFLSDPHLFYFPAGKLWQSGHVKCPQEARVTVCKWGWHLACMRHDAAASTPPHVMSGKSHGRHRVLHPARSAGGLVSTNHGMPTQLFSSLPSRFPTKGRPQTA